MNLEHEVIRHIYAGHTFTLEEENVNVNLLYSNQGKSILSFALDYLERSGESPLPAVLDEEFELGNELRDEPTTSVEYLADKLRERYLLLSQDKIIEDLALVEPDQFTQKLLYYAQHVSANTTTNNFRVSTHDYQDVIARHQRAIEEGYTIGQSLGFAPIDKHTGGARKGQLIFLSAAPKRKKTWFLIKSFIERVKAGYRPIFFTLELTNDEIMGRIFCLISGISYSNYYHGTLMPKDWKKIEAAAEEFASYGEALIVNSPYDERYVSNFVTEAQRAEADSIIVDQLSFVRWTGNHYKENEGYKEVVYAMKNAANTYEMPWYVACQLNREADESEDMPTVQKIGLTRSVEEAADLLLMLRVNQEMLIDSLIQIGVAEARHCESGKNARWMVRAEFSEKTDFTICQ